MLESRLTWRLSKSGPSRGDAPVFGRGNNWDFPPTGAPVECDSYRRPTASTVRACSASRVSCRCSCVCSSQRMRLCCGKLQTSRSTIRGRSSNDSRVSLLHAFIAVRRLRRGSRLASQLNLTLEHDHRAGSPRPSSLTRGARRRRCAARAILRAGVRRISSVWSLVTSPRAVLDGVASTGACARFDGEGRICWRRRAVLRSGDDRPSLIIFGLKLTIMLLRLESLGVRAAVLRRAVHYEGVSRASLGACWRASRRIASEVCGRA